MTSVHDLHRSRAPGDGINHNLFRRRLPPLLKYLSRERNAYAKTEAACRENAAHGVIANAIQAVGPTGWVLLWGGP